MNKLIIPIAVILISFSLITIFTLTNPDQDSIQIIPVSNDSEIIPNGFAVYENETIGMTVNYPENWTVKYVEGNSMIHFVKHDVSIGDLADDPSFGVLVIPISDAFSDAKQMMHASTDGIKSSELVTDVEYTVSDSSIGNKDAIMVNLKETVLNKKLVLLTYYVDVGDKIYVIGYTSPASKYESHLDIANEMFSSFKFI